MPKGYIVVRMTVTDPEAYRDYAAMASEAMRKYGCTPLVRGGRSEALEGEARPRNVVLEFELLRGGAGLLLLPRVPGRRREAPACGDRRGGAGRGGGLSGSPASRRSDPFDAGRFVITSAAK